mmetsp:Transcript_21800/g.29879  ORF Transcript_21800/g.29879 Transcript_21800/m.29879 type:complete len:364 (-) Transcript_21800:82-1173(-)
MADFVAKENVEAEIPFEEQKHTDFILTLYQQTTSFEQLMMEHLRMSAVYWGLAGLATMGKDNVEGINKPELVEWVLSCQHDGGGFGGNTDQDPHMLYTLSAVQILALCGALDQVDGDKVAGYIASLQQPDGSFWGDKWGEVDTRFSYCALSCLALLGRLRTAEGVDVDAAAEFVGRCRNFDGGYGCVPGAESHAGQVFTCVGALSIAHRLDLCDTELLGWWLSERQCDAGGLNGRPEKQADVCYSWWILSALSILGKVSWINTDRLCDFILKCQDREDGGVSDRPGNVADVFHTFFGVAGLSLLGYFDGAAAAAAAAVGAEEEEGRRQRCCPGHRAIDPVFALPADLVAALGLRAQTLPPSSK